MIGDGAAEGLATSLSGTMQGGRFFTALSIAALGGLLTACTPCVYPIVAVTIRYFGNVQGASRRRVLLLACLYVCGMAVLYSALGTLAAAFHLTFGTYLARTWVLLILATFCAAMGLSLLGLFTLELPSGLATRLSRVGGASPLGALAMGLVGGLIAAPCTGPVLAVILTVIATTQGGAGVGFLLMLSFALGMGAPFLVLAIFSGSLQRLPSGGAWMELVKIVLGTAMLVVAGHFLGAAWPAVRSGWANIERGDVISFGLAAGGLIVAGWYVSHLSAGRLARWRALSVALLTGACWLWMFRAEAPAKQRIAWVRGHEEGVARARAEHKPLMVDFGADWCLACKELDAKTYTDPTVQADAARFVSVQVDATTMDDKMDALFAHYGILGLPSVVFVDSSGSILAEPRVTHFVNAERMVRLMAQVH